MTQQAAAEKNNINAKSRYKRIREEAAATAAARAKGTIIPLTPAEIYLQNNAARATARGLAVKKAKLQKAQTL